MVPNLCIHRELLHCAETLQCHFESVNTVSSSRKSAVRCNICRSGPVSSGPETVHFGTYDDRGFNYTKSQKVTLRLRSSFSGMCRSLRILQGILLRTGQGTTRAGLRGPVGHSLFAEIP